MDLNDKSILITGGTGSFGKKFVEIVLSRFKPKKLIIFSRDELKQSEMQQKFNSEALRYFIGDVRDQSRLHRAFQGVDIVVHAAALKQVPACEYNPFEAVSTNIIGAENIINEAIDHGVEKVIALSTDKAANPVNLYGATKLCSDKLFIAGNTYSAGRETSFSVVRDGNVVGSRGSVIPLFNRQKETGKLTITDRRMTRFWITLEQGVEFVISSLERMKGGELYVPKIPSMNIMDLAEAMAPDCTHEFIGIRPGEKLHEVMVPIDDAHRTLEFDDHFIIQPAFPWWDSSKSKQGKSVDDGFSYRSDNNDKWLTKDELDVMIKDI